MKNEEQEVVRTTRSRLEVSIDLFALLVVSQNGGPFPGVASAVSQLVDYGSSC
jgi:hypothetical protein